MRISRGAGIGFGPASFAGFRVRYPSRMPASSACRIAAMSGYRSLSPSVTAQPAISSAMPSSSASGIVPNFSSDCFKHQRSSAIVRGLAGTWIFVPRKTAHAWRCDSPEGRLLSVSVPGGADDFYREVGESVTDRKELPARTVPDVQVLSGTAAQHGIRSSVRLPECEQRIAAHAATGCQSEP